jgi:hypothetical protein
MENKQGGGEEKMERTNSKKGQDGHVQGGSKGLIEEAIFAQSDPLI